MEDSTRIVSGAQRLRQMLSDPSKTVVAPGVYDGISARVALAEGFECLYMVGLSQLSPLALYVIQCKRFCKKPPEPLTS